ncbi:MAG TPA: cupredoxin domain-containing protein [Candidatus Dormibacteraeota bacterium]
MRRALLLLAFPLLLAACGGPAGPPPGSIKVTLSDFAFAPNQIQAKSGSNTFYLVNEGHTSHDFTIVKTDGSGGWVAQSELIQPGSSSTLTVKLDSGNYPVICSQPGHADAGMKATLTVS